MINNISANAAFGFRVDLQRVADDPALGDYVDFEQESWQGLHYRLPVDPSKTMMDLQPNLAAARGLTSASAAVAAAASHAEQHSADAFLGRGSYAVAAAGDLHYYATTSMTGSRSSAAAASSSSKSSAGAKKAAPRQTASMGGQILSATIFANGRVTMTGVRRERDIREGFDRLWHIMRPYAMVGTGPPPSAPPQASPAPSVIIPHQRVLLRQQQREARARARATANAYKPTKDIKPNVSMQMGPARILTLPPQGPNDRDRAIVGTMRKQPDATEANTLEANLLAQRIMAATQAEQAAAAAAVKQEGQALHSASAIAAVAAAAAATLPTAASTLNDTAEDIEWE